MKEPYLENGSSNKLEGDKFFIDYTYYEGDIKN